MKLLSQYIALEKIYYMLFII